MAKIDKAQFRLIKRMSTDCTICVGEDINGNYIVVKNDESQGTFEKMADAYRLFGMLTRQQNE